MLITYIDNEGARAQRNVDAADPVLNHVDNPARVRRLGNWDATYERELFEQTCYANYLTKRASRRAAGQTIAFDTDPDDAPRSRLALFVREENGDYVAVAYQAAWSGWKLARGA